MASRMTIGPSVGGLGIGAVSLIATTTIVETGTIYDGVMQVPHSSCTPTQQRLATAWNDILVPTGVGLVPAGVLIVPPSTNYAIAIQRRSHAASEPTAVDYLHKTAPYLWYFEQAFKPTYIDLNWAGRNLSDQAVNPDHTVDLFNLTSHGLVDGEVIMFTGGTPPVGFTIETTYYVVNSLTSTFKLAATPGSAAIAFVDNGTAPLVSTDNGFLLLWL